MDYKKIDGICIAEENVNCDECELKNVVLCHFSKSFANKFLIGNTIYRILAIFITILVGILVNQWWMFVFYTLSTILVFFFIEPRLLCSHCPFYAKEGRFLRCWALRGMPKFWKFHPAPSTKLEKNLMLTFGAIIDLFPFVAAAIGIIGALMIGIKEILPIIIFILLIGSIISFIILVGAFQKLLMKGTCTKCVNFSCAMNKTPKELREIFLEKSPTMGKAWKNQKVS